MTDIKLTPKQLRKIINIWSAAMLVWAFTIGVITFVTTRIELSKWWIVVFSIIVLLKIIFIPGFFIKDMEKKSKELEEKENEMS